MPRSMLFARPRAAALLAFLLCTLPPARPAHAQSWLVGPGHGGTGGNVDPVYSWTTWDPDGAGPLPADLVIGSDRGVFAWHAGAWIRMGSPDLFYSTIDALVSYQGQLYAAGDFMHLGGDAVAGIARWDGAHWVPLGGGLLSTSSNPNGPIGEIHALEVYNGVLYIGGFFKPADLGAQVNVAAWDGASWIATPPTPTQVNDFTSWSGQLYCATEGYSGTAGVWRLDTTGNLWKRVGPAPSGSVRSIVAYQGELWAGGDFQQIYTNPVTAISCIAHWNGSSWAPAGDGVIGAYEVDALGVYYNQLIAAGYFPNMDHHPANNIAAWDGIGWSALGSGLDVPHISAMSHVTQVGGFGSDLVAAGLFYQSGPDSCRYLARWDGTRWRPFVEGLNGRVRTFFPAGTGIYAGGDFDFTWGGWTLHHIFGGDGSTLDPLYTPGNFNGVNGSVNAITLFSPRPGVVPANLEVGGSFTMAGATAASDIAAYGYYGGDFGTVGAGFGAPVNALASYNRQLWAAGAFTNSGATPLSHLAYLGAGGWTSPGPWDFPAIGGLTTFNGQLIIGGAPGGAPGVSAWNGSTISTLGLTDAPVLAFANYNGDLIAAGGFSSIDGVPAAGVARRDASSGTWAPMGAGFPGGAVYALAVYGGNLYAGGAFLQSGGADTRQLARWNGGSWEQVLGGLDGPVYTLAVFDYQLQVGGDFYRANGGAVSPYWIRYFDGVTDAGPLASAQPPPLALGECHPNPAHGGSHINFTLAHAGHEDLAIYDVAGRTVRTLSDGWAEAGEHDAAWDGRDESGRPCSDGIYFYRLQADGRTLARRMVLLGQ